MLRGGNSLFVADFVLSWERRQNILFESCKITGDFVLKSKGNERFDSRSCTFGFMYNSSAWAGHTECMKIKESVKYYSYL